MRHLFIEGLPKPQGSKKHVGHGRLVESSKGLRKWRHTVHEAARKKCEEEAWAPMDGPISLHLHFFLPRPKAHPKRKATHADRQPDLSKLIRAVEDSLTTAGWWADDARVVHVNAYKHYSIPPELTDLIGESGYCVPTGVRIITYPYATAT